ncbi:cupin domain-containing protein [Nocardia africana]|uniref:Cupin domain-containing protein n=1 Tax=Nocardia africana TaxID=134964 RepID=A0ABW6NGQ8_9NOCA
MSVRDIDNPGVIHRRGDDVEIVHGPHAGGGAIEIEWYFRDSSTLPAVLAIWTIEPGAAEGIHAHGQPSPLEEIYVVIDGEVEAFLDSNRISLRRGDALRASPGTCHGVVNSSTEIAKILLLAGTPDLQARQRLKTIDPECESGS